MNERLAKKLKKLLLKIGVEEEDANEFVGEVDELLKTGGTETNPDDQNDEQLPPDGQNDVVDDSVPPADPQNPDVPEEPQEPQPPADEPQLPPADEPQPPVVPVPDPETEARYQEVLAALDEQKKANQGLMQRIVSLEDALKAAGILEGNPQQQPQQQIGPEQPSLPESMNGTENLLQDVLRQVNGR